MTPEQRYDAAVALDDLDRQLFIDLVAEHYPDVFDAVTARVGRVTDNLNTLAAARRTATQQGDTNS